MSSRQEEKEKRRQERLAAEQAAKRAADRRKRLGIVGGVVLAAAIAVVIVLAVVAGGEEGSNQVQGDVAVPAQQIADLGEAAKAAGCTTKTHPVEGDDHTSQDVEYKTNPPTSGNHDPTWSEDGIYAAGNPPDLEQSVHTLEHGRINFQYKPGTPVERINQLETLFNEEVKGTAGYHSLLYENQTGMDAAVAATTWTQSLTCAAWNDKIFDALRAFRRQYVDKGPEFVP